MNIFSTNERELQAALEAIDSVCKVDRRELTANKLPFQVRGEFYLLFTKAFFYALRSALASNADATFRLLCLDPDPRDYYFKHFEAFPLVTFCDHDTPSEVLRALGEDPGGSPADAM